MDFFFAQGSDFGSWTELFALLGTFTASGYALIRHSLQQHRGMVDRLVSFLDDSLRRQEEANERFRASVERLNQNVQDNGRLLSRLIERERP
jgi:hypothetical protein